MTRKPLQDDVMNTRSVRLTDAEWAALAEIGAEGKPVKAGPATMVRVAVQDYIKRKRKGGGK